MKHLRTGAWVAGLIFSLPLMAGAQSTTIAELEALIRSLSEQLRVLQAQQGSAVPAATPSSTSSGDACGIFVDTLRIGSAGPQVARLHAILAQEGFSVSSADLSASRYGEVTARVVSGLQEKYRAEILTPAGLTYGTGIVGASTRAKLNRLACTTSVSASLPTQPLDAYQYQVVPVPTYRQTILTSQPSIKLRAESMRVGSGKQFSDESLSIKVGETVSISGVPQGLEGLSYYYGAGLPPAGYYQRAYYFDSIFDHSCSNNEASVNSTWTLSCTPTRTGTGRIYVRIYVNGLAYDSNVLTITVLPADAAPPPVAPASAPVISYVSPSSATVGSTIYVYGSNFNQYTFVYLDGDYGPLVSTNYVSPTTLKFVIPAGATVGTHNVFVNEKASGWPTGNSVPLEVLATPPMDVPPPTAPTPAPTPTAPTPAPTPTPTPTYSFLNILTNWNLPSARVGEPYTAVVSASGGSDSYQWSHTSGTLPPGMQVGVTSCYSSLCQQPFSLSGTPTTPGTYTFTFIVQSGQQTAVRMFNLTVTGDTPPPTTPATAIIGYLDAANCDIFGGWTLDQDSPSSQLQIEVWSRVDNLYWKKIMSALANVARSDITAAYNAGDHAFSFYTPSSLKDGKTHSIYIYARNPRGEYITLSGSGTQLRCTSVSQNSLNQIANSIQAIQAMIKNLVR